MQSWTDGYVADIGYVYGYSGEQSAQRVRFAMLNAGLACPPLTSACELGFGQGLSVNLHAAATTASWHGTDFNPAQAAFAQGLASVTGAKAHLFDQDFAQFCGRSDLPDFDFIGLNGIWSWVSAENRAIIVDFIGRKLKPGGVVYLSYNTLPGWAGMLPMRELMHTHSTMLGAPGAGSVARIDAALAFGEQLLALSPALQKAEPLLAQRMADLKGRDRHYLAHEYFNRCWQPMSFSATAELLAPAKLDYACSASPFDNLDAVDLNEEQQALMATLSDPVMRQLTRDFMVNQQFRRDYWVKGARRLVPQEQIELIERQRVMLLGKADAVPLRITSSGRDVQLAEALYRPILTALADGKPITIGQLTHKVSSSTISPILVRLALQIFVGNGHVVCVREDADIAAARNQCERFNAHLLARARFSADLGFLASPVTGEGFALDRISQLLLLGLREGRSGAEALARFVWPIFNDQGQKFIKQGVTLETVAENEQEMLRLANSFIAVTLPMLKALQIAR